ncbi:hypothetical protein [Azospirillum endophyticum]
MGKRIRVRPSKPCFGSCSMLRDPVQPSGRLKETPGLRM